MESLLTIIQNWIIICPWMLYIITMFTFLLIGVVMHYKVDMSWKKALVFQGGLGVIFSVFIYVTNILIQTGIL